MTLSAPPPWSAPEPLPDGYRTQRVLLRTHRPEDADAVHEAVASCRDSLHPWMPWALTDHLKPLDSLYWIEHQRRERAAAGPLHTNFVIGIFSADGAGVLGGTGFHRINRDAHEAEIGYWVRADARGKGFCTEAARALISWGFTPQADGGWGFRRIHVRHAGRNTASQRVCEKLGVALEGRLFQDRWVPTLGWDDTLVWGVLAEEWDIARQRIREGARPPRG